MRSETATNEKSKQTQEIGRRLLFIIIRQNKDLL
jgi:hypothetical protein